MDKKVIIIGRTCPAIRKKVENRTRLEKDNILYIELDSCRKVVEKILKEKHETILVFSQIKPSEVETVLVLLKSNNKKPGKIIMINPDKSSGYKKVEGVVEYSDMNLFYNYLASICESLAA